MTAWAGLRRRARAVLAEVPVVLRAVRDPRTPWLVRVVGLATLAYALSPIDLIPDFIPVLGQLDDLLLVPLGMALTVRMIPREVLEDARRHGGAHHDAEASVGRVGALLVVGLWLLVLAAVVAWVASILR